MKAVVKPNQFRSNGWIVTEADDREVLYVRCNNETKSYVGAKRIINKLNNLKKIYALPNQIQVSAGN